MTAYQVLPGLLPEEYAALRADIKAHGIRVPVDQDENGQVLDGHHRSLIAAELGIDCPRRLVAGLTEAEKVAHAIAVNAHRRHLTQQQKRDLLAASIKADPEASDREHARIVGADHKTAGAVRGELASTGEVPQLDSRRGADGRTRPASQPPRPQPLPPEPTAPTVEAPTSRSAGAHYVKVATTTEQFVAQRDTGEVLSVEDWQAQTAAAGLEQQMATTDARYLSNLFRAITTVNDGLLALDPERAIATCRDLAVERDSLLAFLDRLQSWADVTRAGLRPAHLRSVR